MKHISYHTRRLMDQTSFLSHFENVHEGMGRQQWRADCPSGHSTPQSLSIGLRDGGGYVVHCHAGCEAGAVLGAVGLSLADLYPDGALAQHAPAHRPGKARIVRRPVSPSRLNEVIDTYKRNGRILDRNVWKQWAENVLILAQAQVEGGEELSDEDWDLMKKVASSLRAIG